MQRHFRHAAYEVLFSFFALFSSCLFADVTGSILGTVRDPTGAVVSGASVKAIHLATNETRTTTSDDTGTNRILALPVGRYTIEVIDLVKNPQLAQGDQIFAVPTLVRKVPSPIKKIIGDLSNTERFLIGFDLKPEA